MKSKTTQAVQELLANALKKAIEMGAKRILSDCDIVVTVSIRPHSIVDVKSHG